LVEFGDNSRRKIIRLNLTATCN